MDTKKYSLPDIEGTIFALESIIPSLPRFGRRRAFYLIRLGTWRFDHYIQSGSKEQLDKSILHLVEAQLLSVKPTATSILLFHILVNYLFCRLVKFKQSDDVESCVKYLRYLRNQRCQLEVTPHEDVTLNLVRALEIRVELNTCDIKEDIKEMTILCRELLNSDISGSVLENQLLSLPIAFDNLKIVPNMLPVEEVLDPLIEFFREAIVRLPYSYHLSLALAIFLAHRFYQNHSIIDSEEAITILKKILTFPSDLPQDHRSQFQDAALAGIAGISYRRFSLSNMPEYLEEATFLSRVYHSSASRDHPLRPLLSQRLAYLTEQREIEFGVEEGRYRDPDVFKLPCLSSLAASITDPNSSISDEQWEQHLRALDSMKHTDDIAEIEEAIKYCRLVLASSHCVPSLEHRNHVKLYVALGSLLFHAFRRTGKLEYIDESIAVLHDGLKTYDTPDDRFTLAFGGVLSLTARILQCQQKEDVDELIQIFASLTNDDTRLGPSYRFRFSYAWATLADCFGHPSLTDAYENVFKEMQDYLSYAPTLESQHYRLVSMREGFQDLPLFYASYQIKKGQPRKAIETLERGRALLWSEMRDFRTSTDQLRAVDPTLAAEFEAINKDLEQVTMSMAPCGNMETESIKVEDSWTTDPFSHLVAKQRQFLGDRNKLISRIRALPNFGNFLEPPSFDVLRSAALHGPVIIINHCMWRSDLLVLFRDSLSLITTTHDFYRLAIELGDRLVNARKHRRLESKEYGRALRSVLQSLYELVGKPVIEELRKMKIPEQSRVWWCPTSVFCHLPLHAMGPIPSDDGVTRYFSDIYIPSYTPSLSALIASHKPQAEGQTFQKPSILLVAQPESLKHAIPEIWTIQRLTTTVTSLISKNATPSSVVEGLRHHQFSHFVCHGKLEEGKPFNASFKLSGGRKLTLLEIVRSQLPTAEFAFLSACHTAELTEKSIPGEALHLTAAMQYCGFRSVVGTMWEMADQDGQYLAEDFYKSILSSDEPGVPYYERSARALRDAVKKLRSKKASLERWVNYVHYGA
ncbi:CHAT domain-containing protein [Lactifluus volemus]|nr:CHAT domain-containing protein [Lactifluus volemus]